MRPRRGSVVGAVGLLVVVLSMFGSGPAVAANNACGPDQPNGPYEYAGLSSSARAYGGAWAEISTPSVYLPVGPSQSHLLNYIGVRPKFDYVDQRKCGVITGSCQVQGGNGYGHILNYTSTTPSLYVERDDIFGYQDVYYGTNIGTNTSYKIFFNGATDIRKGVTVGQFDVKFDNHVGNGYQTFGTAWLPDPQTQQVLATLEVSSEVHGYCPIVNPYENFGQPSYPRIQYSPNGQGSGWIDASYGNTAYYIPNTSKYRAYENTPGNPSRFYAEGS